MVMEIGALRQFAETIRCGSITGAAQKLNLVQSTISLSVQGLERELGTILLYRGRDGVSPTPAGKILYEGCIDVLERVERLAGEVLVESWGPLVIGSLESLAVTRLAPFLVRYRERHGQVSMKLITADHSLLAARLLDRSLDLALVTSPENGLDCTLLFNEELGIVSPGGGPFPSSLRELKGKAFLVLPEGCSFRKRLDRIFATHRMTAERIEMNSIGGILACVSAGMGHALVSRSYYEAFPSHEELSFLPLEKESMPVYLAYRKDKWKDLSFSAFEKEIREDPGFQSRIP